METVDCAWDCSLARGFANLLRSSAHLLVFVSSTTPVAQPSTVSLVALGFRAAHGRTLRTGNAVTAPLSKCDVCSEQWKKKQSRSENSWPLFGCPGTVQVLL